MFKLTNISILLFITAIVNLFTFYASWQRRRTTGGYYFAFGMFATTFWVLASALDYAAISIPLKVFFAKLETIFYNSALVLIFSFSLSYAGYGHWLARKWFRLILWVMPIINILLPITNQWHGLFWSGFTRSPVGDNILIFHHGPAFAWAVGIGYVAIIFMLGRVLRLAYRSTGNTRRQALILFSALMIPVVSNLLYLVEIPGLAGIDWTSIFFSLSGLLILLALFGTRFLDIVPVARRSIVEQMSDPILVLDQNQHLVDFNISAGRLFYLTKDAIGLKFQNALAAYPEIVALSTSNQNQTLSIDDNTGENRYFNIKTTLLCDHRGTPFAKLLVFRDMTESYQAEQMLTERLAEIESLNESLHEAQEMVVEQARTLAKVEERERLGRDLHDSVNQSIHSVMLSAETLQALLAKEQTEKAAHVAERIQISGLQALKEIRLLLYEITSPFKDDNVSFIDLIEERLQMVERRVGIQAEMIVLNRERLNCSRDRIENLYWLAIEALNNSLKYANACQVIVHLNCTDEHLIVEIEDNGIGFELEKVKGGGLGMRTMRERADLLGGSLEIVSSPGHGTTVRFCATIDEV